MTNNLYGNPHSNSPASQSSTQQLEATRLAALQLFAADPAQFDLVFVANATAGIKLVQDCFRAHPHGFWFGYHKDSHTSLVGVREAAAAGSQCFSSDAQVEQWLSRDAETSKYITTGIESPESRMILDEVASSDSCSEIESSCEQSYQSRDQPTTPLTTESEYHVFDGCADHQHPEALELFAWPAQSNMNGRRLPLSWASQLRHSKSQQRYTLLDAASLVSTSPLDLSDPDAAPDFTVLSFYKMFGFPDLGAIIVRKEAANVLRNRQYFGGGTVDMVAVLEEQWHASKKGSMHVFLEDGTPPIHSILALQNAIDVHRQLYGSFNDIARHTHNLAQRLYDNLSHLRHANEQPLCKLYSDFTDQVHQGPIIAMNILDSRRKFVSNTEVERLAGLHNISLRSGGLCNPGGVASALGLAPWELKRNFSNGNRCGSEEDVVDGKPLSVLRISLGAMSTSNDIEAFIKFLKEFFVEQDVPASIQAHIQAQSSQQEKSGSEKPIVRVEELVVFPIKSCAGWSVPPGMNWPLRPAGLAWDREWCIIHSGTGNVLTQKRCPRMVLVQPHLDFEEGRMHIRLKNPSSDNDLTFSVPLSADPSYLDEEPLTDCTSAICDDIIQARSYKSTVIATLLTKFLNVPCQLARFPSNTTQRYTKPHLQTSTPSTPLHLSNESPLLAITRESLTHLNQQIALRQSGQSPEVEPSAFRPNIILSSGCTPFAEDTWTTLTTDTNTTISILGPCRRCQMVCTDHNTGERRRDAEPLATLSKMRRRPGGGSWFGVHMRSDGNGGGLMVGERLCVGYKETG